MKWIERLKKGLSKTSNIIVSGVSQLFSSGKLDEKEYDRLEEALIMADLGEASLGIVAELKKHRFSANPAQDEVLEALSGIISKKLEGAEAQVICDKDPTVILLCGVNGNGKTTTCGKLGLQFANEGKKVMFIACDTFRAAAVEQLKVWADRAQSGFFAGEENADPASVVFKGIQHAKDNAYDVVLIDTAGRLHNKSNLMDELSKIYKVIGKVEEGAPHYSLLVLDGTTGQNAMMQAEIFSSAIPINGFIINKLDSGAKAGIIIPIYEKLKKPIFSVGVGEQIEDLHAFKIDEYVKALLKGD